MIDVYRSRENRTFEQTNSKRRSSYKNADENMTYIINIKASETQLLAFHLFTQPSILNRELFLIDDQSTWRWIYLCWENQSYKNWGVLYFEMKNISCPRRMMWWIWNGKIPKKYRNIWVFWVSEFGKAVRFLIPLRFELQIRHFPLLRSQYDFNEKIECRDVCWVAEFKNSIKFLIWFWFADSDLSII